MLILSDEEVERLLPMSICIEAMEMTFREFAQGLASGRPRQRYVCPTPTEGAMYWANVHCGAVLGAGVAAVRVDTNLRTDKIGVDPRMTYRKSRPVNWGQVYLYSLETSEPLCIMPDRALSGVRVGATSALGARYLARQDARVLGLFGSGDQSRSNLEGVLQTVPSIKEVRVYSPNVSHRETFVEEMSQRLGMPLTAAGSAREVVEGTDIILCTTNSSRPLFPGDWLKAGQLVITIVNSDTVAQRTEVDEATFVRSDLIVINDRESVYGNNQRELLDPIDQGKFGWDKVRQLGDLVTGAHPGRRYADEIMYYKNNSGLGIQFAGAGGLVYRRALEQKVGREIPTEWFATDLSQEYARGFYH